MGKALFIGALAVGMGCMMPPQGAALVQQTT